MAGARSAALVALSAIGIATLFLLPIVLQAPEPGGSGSWFGRGSGGGGGNSGGVSPDGGGESSVESEGDFGPPGERTGGDDIGGGSPGDGEARNLSLNWNSAWIILAIILGIALLVALVMFAKNALARGGPEADLSATEGADAARGALASELAALPAGSARDVVAAYADACAALALASLVRHPAETAREFASRCRLAHREFNALTRMYEAARHGNVDVPPDAVEAARDLARAVARAALDREATPSG